MNTTARLDRETPENRTISYLLCTKLVDHPLRMGFYSEMHLQKLMNAIESDGLLQPVIVYPTNQQFHILSGHYRIRAVRRLRWEQIPCMVFTGSAEDALRIYCTSNLLTRGLNPIEEAHIIAQLIQAKGMTMDQIGALLGHSKSWVSRRLQMLHVLDPKIRRFVESGELPPRFAQEIARLPQGNDQQRVLNLIQKQQMTKDDANSLVNWWRNATEAEKSHREETAKPYTPSLVEYTARALHKCSSTIDDLVDVLRQHTIPWDALKKEWTQLNMAVQTLVQIVATQKKEGDSIASHTGGKR